MCAVCLVSLFALAPGVGWADAWRVRPGMTKDQAEDIVGGTYSVFFVASNVPGVNRCQAYYHHTDWLGGVTSLSALYLWHGTDLRLVDCGVEYWPFHDTPPWLDALRAASLRLAH